MRLPAERAMNNDLSEQLGRPVVRFEVVPVGAGQVVTLSFDSVNSDWRQGIWLGTEGGLRVNGVENSQLVVWHDSAPEVVRVEVAETDGLLRFYNVWDSGRGLGPHESQSATCGMLMTELPDGSRRYGCNDIGFDPAFDKIVFTMAGLR